jgi:predicted nucleic acid-binding protein
VSRYVIDSSAATEYLLRTPLGLKLVNILEDATLLAPELLDVEVMSVLRRAVLRGELSDQRAALALDDLTDWGVDRIPHLRLLQLAWQHRNNVSAHRFLCSRGASRQRNPANHRRPACPRSLSRNYRRKHQLAVMT